MLILPMKMNRGSSGNSILKTIQKENVLNHKTQNQRDFSITFPIGSYSDETDSDLSPLKDTKNWSM